MGCDTKGVVVTTNKDVKLISTRIGDTISKIKGHRPEFPHLRPNSRVSPEYNPWNNFLSFYFYDGTDYRKLMVFLECDCDNKKLGEHSISMLLGCWGNSEELMKKFLDALSDLGDCYIDVNDCDESGFEQYNKDKELSVS